MCTALLAVTVLCFRRSCKIEGGVRGGVVGGGGGGRVGSNTINVGAANSDIDHRIFNVRMCFLLMRLHTGDLGLWSHPKDFLQSVHII